MATDPYRYFRVEARELIDGLNRLALELERSGGGAEPVAQILRNAHTLKGASRVVKHAQLAELAHAAEGVLEPHRGGGTVQKEAIDRLLAIVDQMTAALETLQPGNAAASSSASSSPSAERAPVEPTPSPPSDVVESLRVDVEEIDSLLDSVSEVQVQVSALRRIAQGAEESQRLARALVEQLAIGGRLEASPRARAAAEALRAHLTRHERELAQSVSQMGAELSQAKEIAGRLRLVPVASLRLALERAVRDAAHAMGKRVELRLRGGGLRLDAHVLTGVRDALLHVVRNAVTHGIEPLAQRLLAKKPEVGAILVDVQRTTSWVVFRVSDDGAGLDVQAIAAAALQRGRIDASRAQALDETRAGELLLGGGVSTAGHVDELAGRGVGLDAVRAIAEGLKGEVRVTSRRGQGFTLELRVPASLASIRALSVSVGDVEVAVPLDAVRRTLHVRANELTHGADRRTLVYEGTAIPFTSLARLLGHEEPDARAAWSTLVVEGPSGLAALAVDRLTATSEVLLRPPPKLAAVDGVVAGTALDDEGDPKLVLDPAGLVAAAQRQRHTGRASERPRPPILVVDDSLTTRMLEQAILESAGYEVELAASAEEGLVKAHARRYGLVLCDVEMPGMDGFQFVSATRADPGLREVPVILVTSRDTEADRRRGLEAGAMDYVVKGEFDQGRLLETIKRLLG